MLDLALETYTKSDVQLGRELDQRRRRRRDTSLAAVSTLILLVVVVAVVVSSPGWPRVRETFLSWSDLTGSVPDVLRGFWLNVRMFLIAEPIILLVGLAVSVVRGIRSPALFPLRALAVLYVDVFRGVPTILVIFVIGFGLPALQLQGVPSDPVVLGTIALVLSYGAYVAEVFRSGIESIHPSQHASARSLGLTQVQTLRFVILPQAVRRVVPPLLNDFVSLQKDTALVAVLGPLEALRQAQIYSASTFNYSSYLPAAALFILLTIPLARFTDYLAAKTLRERGA
ncbi:amino acid ABC transporter permease [Streptomyces sp. NPDC001617]